MNISHNRTLFDKNIKKGFLAVPLNFHTHVWIEWIFNIKIYYYKAN